MAILDVNLCDLEPIPHPRDQILSEMRKDGLFPPDMVMDGKIHRFKESDTKSKDSGWYIFFDCVVASGAYGSWKSGLEKTFSVFVGRDLSSEEMIEQKNAIESAKLQREAEKKELQRVAAVNAYNIFTNALDATSDHSYLLSKKVKPHGSKISDRGDLIIPRYNVSGKLISLQFINSVGDKKFLYGGEVTGGFYLLGNITNKIYLCEGFATGATIFEATGCATSICFSAGNLPEVAKNIRKQHEHAEIIIVADNDESGTGAKFSEFAADLVGAAIIMPPTRGQDVNDFYLSGGDVKQLLEPKKSEWFVDANDFKKQPSPIKWLIKKLIPEKSLIMYHGASGSGKTFVVLDMCMRIASDYKDYHGYKVNDAPVVYLAGEGHTGIQKRVVAWEQYYKPENKLKLWVSKSGCNLDDTIKRQEVIEQIRMLPYKPALIVVDTLHRFMQGDENSSKDAGLMIKACNDLQTVFNCSVLLVHHTGNSDDAKNRARGSSAWRGDIDIEMSIKAPKKNSSTISVEQMKTKDEDLEDILYLDKTVININGWVDEDGEQITSVVLTSGQKPIEKPKTDSEHIFCEAFIGTYDQELHPTVCKRDLQEYYKKVGKKYSNEIIIPLLDTGKIKTIFPDVWAVTDYALGFAMKNYHNSS